MLIHLITTCKHLNSLLQNPAIYDVEFTPHAGGISRSDMQANNDDNDTLSPKIYRGVTTDSGTPDYFNKEIWVDSTSDFNHVQKQNIGYEVKMDYSGLDALCACKHLI